MSGDVNQPQRIGFTFTAYRTGREDDQLLRGWIRLQSCKAFVECDIYQNCIKTY